MTSFLKLVGAAGSGGAVLLSGGGHACAAARMLDLHTGKGTGRSRKIAWDVRDEDAEAAQAAKTALLRFQNRQADREQINARVIKEANGRLRAAEKRQARADQKRRARAKIAEPKTEIAEDEQQLLDERSRNLRLPILKGSCVEGNCRGRGTWYRGVITKITTPYGKAGVVYDIRYDDGDKETLVPGDRVRLAERSGSLFKKSVLSEVEPTELSEKTIEQLLELIHAAVATLSRTRSVASQLHALAKPVTTVLLLLEDARLSAESAEKIAGFQRLANQEDAANRSQRESEDSQLRKRRLDKLIEDAQLRKDLGPAELQIQWVLSCSIRNELALTTFSEILCSSYTKCLEALSAGTLIGGARTKIELARLTLTNAMSEDLESYNWHILDELARLTSKTLNAAEPRRRQKEEGARPNLSRLMRRKQTRPPATRITWPDETGPGSIFAIGTVECENQRGQVFSNDVAVQEVRSDKKDMSFARNLSCVDRKKLRLC